MKYLIELWRRVLLWLGRRQYEKETKKLFPYTPPSAAELRKMSVDSELDNMEVIWQPPTKEPRTGKPLRYDEVQRARKRERKGL